MNNPPKTSGNLPRLSKSRVLAGLQCLKRLYLECYQREFADPVDRSRQAIFDAGTAVGILATDRFPDGQLVKEQYYEHSKAVSTTKALLENASLTCLYEPAFTYEGIRTRVDILRRTGDGKFDLIEVKSTTGVKDVHIPDVAAQLYVVEGSGISVDRAYVMHINREYVYGGGEHDLEELFALANVTDAVRSYATEYLPDSLEEMWDALKANETPERETGHHCTTPYRCPFFGHCHADEPDDPIRELPGLRQQDYERLDASGLVSVNDIPDGFPGLTELQRRVRDSVVTGQPFIGTNLSVRLDEIEFPASFLDFETFSPPIPLYAQTRPYQTIPFQWSLHVLDEDGTLEHTSYLHDGPDDPRRKFIVSLFNSVPAEGSIVTYSNYEQTVLKALARDFPEHESQLLALCDRVVDLLRIVRSGYYHPAFRGSFSLKSVLPALVPDIAYDDLELSEGIAAASYYGHLLSDDLTDAERIRLREALRAYCARDTEAMVRVYDALMKQTDNQKSN